MSVDEETTVDMAVAEVASAEMDANGSSVGETPAANPTASETEGLDAPVAEASALTQRRLLESSVSTQRGLLESSAFNKALIVACALAWGFSFFVMKDVTELFPVFWLLLVRFGISSVIMAVVFRKAILRESQPLRGKDWCAARRALWCRLYLPDLWHRLYHAR